MTTSVRYYVEVLVFAIRQEQRYKHRKGKHTNAIIIDRKHDCVVKIKNSIDKLPELIRKFNKGFWIHVNILKIHFTALCRNK